MRRDLRITRTFDALKTLNIQDKFPKSDIIIEGPISLTEFKSELLHKHIYLFGDEHTREGKCKNSIRIDQFIEKIVLDNKDKTIDLFLELDFPNSGRDTKYQIEKTDNNITYLPTPDYITDIFHKFYFCFQHDKKDCKYTNLRTHYTDIRYLGTNKYVVDYVNNVNNVYHTIQARKILRLYNKNDSKQAIKGIIADGLKILAVLPVKIEDMYKVAKVQKQLDNIKDKNLVDLIYKHFDNKLTSSLFNAEVEYKSYTEDTDIDQIRIGINYLFDYVNSLLEIYIIGRMLRSFNNKEVNNIIVYAGDEHIKSIINFLSTIPEMKMVGPVESNNRNNGNFQCINTSLFNQSFFS